MRRRTAILVLLSVAIVPAAVLLAYQMRHSQRWEWEMQDPVEDPPDADKVAEFTFARLRYHGGGYGRRFRGAWGTDANRADRLFAVASRRLTRIETRSVEEVIDAEEGPMMDYPWLYAVEVGSWGFTESQAKRLREYLDRGGFLMVDDFHGTYEWEAFMAGLRKVFPDRSVVDIPNDDPIFHIVSDLGDRFQVPGMQYLYSGNTWEKGGYKERWAAIYDERGRIQVAICHNMDLGDAWEYADYPQFPEKFASLALRIGVNYAAYAMTH